MSIARALEYLAWSVATVLSIAAVTESTYYQHALVIPVGWAMLFLPQRFIVAGRVVQMGCMLVCPSMVVMLGGTLLLSASWLLDAERAPTHPAARTAGVLLILLTLATTNSFVSYQDGFAWGESSNAVTHGLLTKETLDMLAQGDALETEKYLARSLKHDAFQYCYGKRRPLVIPWSQIIAGGEDAHHKLGKRLLETFSTYNEKFSILQDNDVDDVVAQCMQESGNPSTQD